MLFCCLWCNVETSCRKHFVVVSRHQQTPPLTTTDKCHNLQRSDGTVLITPGGRSVDIMGWNKIRIAISVYPTYIWAPLWESPSEYCRTVWYGKLEWFGYPMVFQTEMVLAPRWWKKLKICLFVLKDFTNVTYGHTNTAWQHRPYLRSISQQKFWQSLTTATDPVTVIMQVTVNVAQVKYTIHNMNCVEWDVKRYRLTRSI